MNYLYNKHPHNYCSGQEREHYWPPQRLSYALTITSPHPPQSSHSLAVQCSCLEWLCLVLSLKCASLNTIADFSFWGAIGIDLGHHTVTCPAVPLSFLPSPQAPLHAAFSFHSASAHTLYRCPLGFPPPTAIWLMFSGFLPILTMFFLSGEQPLRILERTVFYLIFHA